MPRLANGLMILPDIIDTIIRRIYTFRYFFEFSSLVYFLAEYPPAKNLKSKIMLSVVH